MKAPLLLGQSALEKLGSIQINGDQLIIYQRPMEARMMNHIPKVFIIGINQKNITSSIRTMIPYQELKEYILTQIYMIPQI